ncbi:MAG: sulfite exporter TauE/SafE family protein [Acidobacteria bacterium]|nr:sulfite exporter TauE/SafE family protein [Acidobacteriota bacterium]
MPEFAAWQWLLGAVCAFVIGIAKTGLPGVGSFVAPLMVLAVGDARHAAAWTLPILSTADVFAVAYWRRHADAGKLFSLVPWVAVGMAGGALALSLSELVLRRIIGVVVVIMLAVHLRRKRNPQAQVAGSPPFYGVASGFASTIANAAAPVMNMYLLSRKLTKEQGPRRYLRRSHGTLACPPRTAARLRHAHHHIDDNLRNRSVPVVMAEMIHWGKSQISIFPSAAAFDMACLTLLNTNET